MSDSILSNDLTIYYADENRRKQIKWTGGALKTDVQKMIDVYDATEDLFTLSTQMDDGVIFSAETPGEYTIGKIDAGELDPWFIDLASMEHIIGDSANFTGCAVKTSGWTRVQDSNTGIVVVAVTQATNNIVIGDIGNDITHADGDAGTLLDVVTPGGATDYLFIRPDSSAAANNFDSTSLNLTCNAHTAPQEAAAVTGEMVWGNVYSQGGILPDTHVYLFQDGLPVTKIGSTTEDWWPDQHLERAVPITDYKSAGFPIIDGGYLTVFGHKYSGKNSYAEIRMNTTSGGNVSAPLSTGEDSNNTTGYSSILLGGGAGNWNVGDEISGDVSGARGVITLITGSNPTPTLHYYLIGDPLIDFNGTEAISNEDDTGTATSSGAPAAQGPALAGWFNGAAAPTVVFANTNIDVDEDATLEPYAATVDLNQASLAELYEWAKYVARRGSTFDLDGLDGQEFIGITYRVNYTTLTLTVSEGDTVTGVTSGASGVVVSHHTTEKILMLRNTRGTFIDAEQIQVDGSNYVSGGTVTALTPIAECWLGTLAGGAMFCSVGYVLTDFITSEENSFTLYDVNGVSHVRPTSITMAISNLAVADWAATYRLLSQGGAINKAEYTATGGEVAGDPTLTTSTIAVDVPGKTVGGRLILVDADDNNKEYAIRYASWTGGVFTLANYVGIAEALTTSTKIVDVGVFANAQVGDLIYNSTRTAVSYITEVVSDDEVNIFPAITGQVATDNFEVNCIPIAVTASDKIYVPIILKYVAAGTSVSASMQYLAAIYGRTRVRNTSDGAVKIKPFTSDVTIDTGGGSTTAVRTTNTVYGS